MTRALSILLVASALACSSDENELKVSATSLAVKRAAVFCNVPQSEMTWLALLIEATKDDISTAGPIYAFRSNGEGIFMHQPWIMSCMGCILYDCEGNRMDSQEIDATALTAGFQNLTEIYVPDLE